MSLRVMFVDDEPNVLDGLRRTLRVFRHEWDMRFATSGAATLTALANEPADVVVSDMRMPGMDGDSLLAEVRQRYPQTVRIVLTGECTREAMLRVASLAHRILAKPCDPELLKAAVRQASALQMLLLGPHLAAVVGQMRSVPSKPELYTRILPVLDDPDSSLADLGRLLDQDVGVSAKLIQMANSVMFGSPRPISSVADAVRQLGSEMTKSLILADGILTRFDPQTLHPYSIGDLWGHSQQVGALAFRIARTECPAVPWLNMVQSVGMLHDVGRLVLAAAEPERYVAVLEMVQSGKTTVDAERHVFGVTHAEVGAYLLGLWGLPTAVVEAVAWHHTPTPSGCPVDRFDLVTAVHAAESILDPKEGGGPDAEYIDRLGLAHRLPAWAELADDLCGGGHDT